MFLYTNTLYGFIFFSICVQHVAIIAQVLSYVADGIPVFVDVWYKFKQNPLLDGYIDLDGVGILQNIDVNRLMALNPSEFPVIYLVHVWLTDFLSFGPITQQSINIFTFLTFLSPQRQLWRPTNISFIATRVTLNQEAPCSHRGNCLQFCHVIRIGE